MKFYTGYINDYSEAQKMYRSIKGEKKFHAFTEEARLNPRTKENELDSFLILPVQR